MNAQLVADALVMAIWRRGKPDALLHHSDQGSQYTSQQFQTLMSDNGVTCSMSRSGNVWDNAAMESFFSSLKTERVRRQVYRLCFGLQKIEGRLTTIDAKAAMRCVGGTNALGTEGFSTGLALNGRTSTVRRPCLAELRLRFRGVGSRPAREVLEAHSMDRGPVEEVLGTVAFVFADVVEHRAVDRLVDGPQPRP